MSAPGGTPVTDSPYCGRFAPSPTGPLHFGSLVSALASFLEARTRQGQWLLRIEDLDPQREPPAAANAIVQSLDRHLLHWDGAVRYQSQRLETYRRVADQLVNAGKAYHCGCSRKELKANNGYHPFHCREGGKAPDDREVAIRFALRSETVCWHDRILGPQQQRVTAEVDDPVIIRKEGFAAYQLAVVVDDIDQGVSDVVRGSDLLETTAQQRQIHQALDDLLPSPRPLPQWAHIPVVLNAYGQKLSKQNRAPALDDRQPGRNLWQALNTLGQQPPQRLAGARPDPVLAWAMAHWSLAAVPRSHSRQPERPET